MMAGNLKSVITLIVFFLLSAIIISIPPTHCSRSLKMMNSSNDEELIDKTCNHTSNYHLCLQYLKADPTSFHSDVKGLAAIMVKVMKAKAEATEGKIQDLLHHHGTPIEEEEALKTCDGCYVSTLHSNIPQAIEALEIGDMNLALSLVTDAAEEAMFCERAFRAHEGEGPSLLTPQNNEMHDVSIIAATIVMQM